MRVPSILCALAVVGACGTTLGSTLGAQRPPTASRPPMTATPPSARVLSAPPFARCDKGAFVLFQAEKTVGRETFEVRCAPDGSVSGTGHSEMTLGPTTGSVTTTVELDPALLPRRATTNGTVNGAPVSVTMTFSDTGATLTLPNGTQKIPYRKGESFIGNNLFFALPLIAARYDMAKGGAQSIPVLGGVPITFEPLGRDDVSLPGDVPPVIAFYRWRSDLGPQAATVWTDVQGRMAALSLPSQQFLVAREEYVAHARALDSMRAARARHDRAAAAAKIDYGAPPGASFTAEEVTIPVGGYTLAGTLLLPKSGKRPVPAVVTISGSGQQTRDEAIPIPGLENYRPFRQIAEALATAGIAVLRVDDRGVGGSTGLETLESVTTSSFANDTRAQVAYLRARREIDPGRIALVGHSEGGVIAPMVAASDPRIAAIVLLAGTATRGDTILYGQMEEALKGDTTLSEAEKQTRRDQQRQALETIRAGGTVPGVNGTAWLREFIDYDPLAAIRAVTQPILILQGENDRQVPASEAPLLERAAHGAGNRNVTMRVFPRLNHLFLPSATGAVAEYSTLKDTNIPPEVIATLRDWLLAKLK